MFMQVIVMDDLQNIKYESPWIDLIITITDFIPLANRSIRHPEDEENTSKHVAVITIYIYSIFTANVYVVQRLV